MITVVIPAYNEKEYLERCLRSLKRQDYSGEYEIIVVDNGSSDGTAQIASNLGAKVVFCPQRGVVRAREAGFRASCGEIIVQAGADTTYPQTGFRRSMRGSERT
jgi:glycosyltransferase involved in cell wall biosynthesis